MNAVPIPGDQHPDLPAETDAEIVPSIPFPSPTPDQGPTPADVIAVGDQLRSLGIVAVTVKRDGSKAPDLSSWKALQTTWPSDQFHESIFHNTKKAPPIGVAIIITGDLECLEFDEDVFAEFQSRADALGIGDDFRAIAESYLERSPGGGYHLFYRCSVIRGNTKLAARPDPSAGKKGKKTLIETRAKGGFIVVAPSHGTVHPSGRPYVKINGDFADILTITPELRDQLFALARTFNEVIDETFSGEPKPEVKRGRPPAGGQGLKPGEDFNQRATWEAIMTEHGWAPVLARGGTTYWRRPGKPGGWSASTNHAGTNLLYVFTSSSVFEQEKTYSKFGAYTLLNHNGDFGKAAKALYEKGFGDRKRLSPHSRRTQGGTPSTTPASPEDKQADRSQEVRQLPVVVATHVEHLMNSEAILHLMQEDNLYQRHKKIVRVLQSCQPRKKQAITRPAGTPKIEPIPAERIRELLTIHMEWVQVRTDKEGNEEEIPISPPNNVPGAIMARGEWPYRPIEGVIEAPTLRPDGSILDAPGYDEETGLLYQPNEVFPPIPREPSPNDAMKAFEVLSEPIKDFPFVDRDHASAWIAAVLTMVGRAAIDGPCPLFMFDANTPGSGKSKLCDLAAIIATGRVMARLDYPEQEEEMAKMLLATAIAADLAVMFDNVMTGFRIGGKSLDRVLTAGLVRGRLLGQSQMTEDLPSRSVFFATGNNIGARGDALRRVCYSRLESPLARPETRVDFKITTDILTWTRENRTRLVCAALTILRAYFVAGKPDQNLTSMDYPAWSNLIRNAVHWASGSDPGRPREAMVQADPEAGDRSALILAWAELPADADGGANGHTAAQAIKLVCNNPNEYNNLRLALLDMTRKGEMPSAKAVGKALGRLRGRVIECVVGEKSRYLTLKDTPLQGTFYWKAVATEGFSSGGFDGFVGLSNDATHTKKLKRDDHHEGQHERNGHAGDYSINAPGDDGGQTHQTIKPTDGPADAPIIHADGTEEGEI